MLKASAASCARVSGDDAQLADLGGDLRVVAPGRRRRRHRPRCAPRRRAAPRRRRRSSRSPRRARRADPDRRRERLDVDDDQVDQPDPLGLELLELGRHVASGQDPGIDRVVERLDLAADVGWPWVSSETEATSMPSRGEVLARAVGRIELDVEREQVPGKRRRSRPGWRRTAGLAPGASSHPRWPCGRVRGGPRVPGRSRRRATFGRVYRLSWHTPAGRPPTSTHEVLRDAAPLGVPVRVVQQRQLPGPVPPDLDRRRWSCWSS